MVVGGSERGKKGRRWAFAVLPVLQVVYFTCGTEKSVENLCSGREYIKGCKTVTVIDSLGIDLQQLSILAFRLISGPGMTLDSLKMMSEEQSAYMNIP